MLFFSGINSLITLRHHHHPPPRSPVCVLVVVVYTVGSVSADGGEQRSETHEGQSCSYCGTDVLHPHLSPVQHFKL